jgi:hypothetical protein
MTDLSGIGSRTDRGYNTTTYSGLPFWPLDPRTEDVRLEDIAHSLSNQCRFNGHCKQFYSVAQHSVLASFYVPEEYAVEALLHDAAEAYVGDMIRPLKAMVPEFVAIDDRVDAVIRQRFGLPAKMSEPVIKIDMILCATERRDLLVDHPSVDWGSLPLPLDRKIVPYSPQLSKEVFLERARELGVE